MEANRIEVSALLRACHGKSDIAALSPFEVTRPSIITDAGCFVVDTLRISEISLPNVTTRSFCLLKTGSIANLFSSEKMRIRFPWIFISFKMRLLLSKTLLNHQTT